jgi:hypothetical protein
MYRTLSRTTFNQHEESVNPRRAAGRMDLKKAS